MADSDDEGQEDMAINERLMDLFVFVPAGLALSVVEDFPKLAARGREKLGARVTSARVIGQFAVKAGADEFRRRSEGLLHRAPGAPSAGPIPPSSATPVDQSQPPVSPSPEGPVTAASSPSTSASPATASTGAAAASPPSSPSSNAHIPAVGTLSIPGFDTLSASQVVQRLDGLNRTELVSVRAYESQTRGRRTILSRVDQLLDERS
jgi:hypothetical protein